LAIASALFTNTPPNLALLEKYRREIRLQISPIPSLRDNKDNEASETYEKKSSASASDLLPPKTKPPRNLVSMAKTTCREGIK
jgi:hypothetical protein